MVPVSHVHHILVRPLRPREDRQHVVRSGLLGSVPDGERCGKPHGYGLESSLSCEGFQGIIVEIRLRKDSSGSLDSQPSLDCHPRHIVVLGHESELGSGPTVLHRAPGIRRRLGFVHDEGAGRPLTCGLLVLVGPPPVVRHRVSIEQRSVFRGEPGVVDQHHHGLATNVQSLVIVPAVLGRHRPVPNKHHLRVADRNTVHPARGPNHDLVTVAESTRGIPAPNPQRCVGISRD